MKGSYGKRNEEIRCYDYISPFIEHEKKIWFKLVGSGDPKEPCEKTESNLHPFRRVPAADSTRIYDLIDDVIFLHLGKKRKPGIFCWVICDSLPAVCSPKTLKCLTFGDYINI